MTDEIEVDGVALPVERSFVRLEIENSRGEVITVHRVVKSDGIDPRLITVMHGAAITDRTAGQNRSDYFVRMPGSAQRRAGFHHFLADFVGWSLPRVTKTDGSEAPLYVECLFPYSFVEQKQGWLGVQPRIPAYFQIRDVVRRSAEFILGLDAYNLALRRQRLEYARALAESEWKQRARTLEGEAAAASVVLTNLPTAPSAVTEPIQAEALVAQTDGTWLSVEAEVSRLSEILQSIEIVPETGPAVQNLEVQLSAVQDQLTASNAAIVDAVADYDGAQARAAHLQERVGALEEDLQRHKDAALLSRLGSRHSTLLGNEPHCPTCNQFLPDGFDITSTPMSTDDNIRFIEQELSTFRNMLSDALRRRDVQATRVHRLREESNAIRSQIRSIKDSLVSPSAMPSIAAIAQQIRIEEQIGALRKFADDLETVLAELFDRAGSWRQIDEELKTLGKDPLSITDREKIGHIDESFRDQLHAYRFRSVSPENITISEDSYKPVHEGFDLGFDLSASDMIRAMWAYLLSFAEVSLKHATNHPGLLVLDEPRQQEVHRTDFATFLQRLARDGSDGLQVIVATSEEYGSLSMMLTETPHNMVSLDPGSKILRPL
ncbi:hypothetical protein [Micromonospora sp. NBC_01638]|uniref:hypothetical protein n=1 Tax=Micromonospora sp. NBC_01638 TaxID=2975982 RepID=UPI003866F4AE|nr:hypothetical protein OG811_02935 [Micromonospora sp. NBC_01638]